MRFKCNCCGGTYSDTQADGTPYFHACPPETIDSSKLDPTDDAASSKFHKPRDGARNENFVSGLVFVDGKPKRAIPDPTRNVPTILIDVESLILAEGKGRTQIG